ncbi:hypothetical protein RRG08_031588 [Elysia crispata]|uniref:Uncharacterized protein n=1 Tax=Elysia crispata TaxID=231223 RepID=A0AAE1B2U8_9GAST|nr:hypothetical protein RRG08_031588 [Elysia crispata]
MNEDLKEQLQAKELLIQDFNSEREKNFVTEKDVEELKLKWVTTLQKPASSPSSSRAPLSYLVSSGSQAPG